MKETRTKGLQPIDKRKHFVGFGDQLDKMFQLFYPLESFDGNNFSFEHGVFKGVNVKISFSDIYLELEYDFIRDKPALAKVQKREFKPLNVFFHYTVSNRTVYLYPRDRDNFPDTPYGAEMRANYFFLVVQAALNQLLQPKEEE